MQAVKTIGLDIAKSSILLLAALMSVGHPHASPNIAYQAFRPGAQSYSPR
jgi:hypothetical protein